MRAIRFGMRNEAFVRIDMGKFVWQAGQLDGGFSLSAPLPWILPNTGRQHSTGTHIRRSFAELPRLNRRNHRKSRDRDAKPCRACERSSILLGTIWMTLSARSILPSTKRA